MRYSGKVTVWLTIACMGALVAPGQNFSDMKVEKVAAGFTFTEGPVWSREGFLVFSDVPGGKILKWTPGEGVSIIRAKSNGASGNAYDAQGRLYTCETAGRRVVRQDKKGKIEVVAERWDGKRLNAPNDIVVRKDGELYFTDPAFGSQQDARELDFFGVYHVSRKGVLDVVAKWKTRPNGIALSASGHLLYVANSDERSVLAYDLDKAGEASGERVFISHIVGVPNGVRVDEKGNVYVAAKDVNVYTSEGKPLIHIPLADGPSNMAFGDPDFGTLYITARTAVYRVRLDVKGAIQY